MYLGRYASPEDAHQAYLKAKAELHPFGTLSADCRETNRLIKSNATGFAGVELRKSGKYTAYFNRGGRRVRLPGFSTAEEAYVARCDAIKSVDSKDKEKTVKQT